LDRIIGRLLYRDLAQIHLVENVVNLSERLIEALSDVEAHRGALRLF